MVSQGLTINSSHPKSEAILSLALALEIRSSKKSQGKFYGSLSPKLPRDTLLKRFSSLAEIDKVQDLSIFLPLEKFSFPFYI